MINTDCPKYFQRDHYERIKVPIPVHQVLPLTEYIFEVSFSKSVTWIIKISSMGQSELRNLCAGIDTLTHRYC